MTGEGSIGDSQEPWRLSTAADDALKLASAFSLLSVKGSLSPAVAFLALCERAMPEEFGHLATDDAAKYLRRALDQTSSLARSQIWSRTLQGPELSTGNSHLTFGDDVRPIVWAKITPALTGALRSARKLSEQDGHDEITSDSLIRAIFETDDRDFNQALEHCHLNGAMLLKAYLDAKAGKIAQLLLNDTVAPMDRLGYSLYVRAISKFLLDPGTIAPLSVSIQAPWGVGKSSLMRQLQEAIDPSAAREASGANLSKPFQTKMKLKDVLHVLKRSNHWCYNWRRWSDAYLSLPSDKRQNPFLNIVAKSGLLFTTTHVDISHGSDRCTVWFNAWKYENSTQVWAGLVDAIVSQISLRLPQIQREMFLMQLHLSRIDDGIVRKKIYDRIANLWWNGVRGAATLGVTLSVSIYAVKAAEPPIGIPKQLAEAMTKASEQFHLNSYDASLIIAGLTVAYIAFSYYLAQNKTKEEPASFSLADYLSVPDYSQTQGSIHNIHKDLMRVMNIMPLDPTGKPSPIVIFIDDLDRCTPSNIASVVEGVSMFLASDMYRCVFVIGMDPQMIAAALGAAHKQIIENLPAAERTVPLGWRFMDKFVQLPFTIPPPNASSLSDYIDGLTSTSEISATTPESSDLNTMNSKPPITATGKIRKLIEILGSELTKNHQPVASTGSAPALPTTDRSKPEATETLDITLQHDVGVILRAIGKHIDANPRELKRMANLARFYLFLRNERLAANSRAQETPSIDQYARWICLTCRWPDMARWLLWGADEANWEENISDLSLICRRLTCLENIAKPQTTHLEWKAAIKHILKIQVGRSEVWCSDVKLFEFFKSENRLKAEWRLSRAYHVGFW